MSFVARVPIRFNQADPGGILFFAKVYEIAHDVYEDFVRSLGFEWKAWFQNESWAVPIRHSTCEYYAPIWAGMAVDVTVNLERVGESSFTIKYDFKSGDKRRCTVELVHTFLDKKTIGKMPIPSEIRGKLEAYQRESGSAQ